MAIHFGTIIIALNNDDNNPINQIVLTRIKTT